MPKVKHDGIPAYLNIKHVKLFLTSISDRDTLIAKNIISYFEKINIEDLSDEDIPKYYNKVCIAININNKQNNLTEIVTDKRVSLLPGLFLDPKVDISSVKKDDICRFLEISDLKSYLNPNEHDHELEVRRVISYVMQTPISLIGLNSKVIISDVYAEVKDILIDFLKVNNILSLVRDDKYTIIPIKDYDEVSA